VNSVGEIFERSATAYDRASFPFFTPFGEALVEFASVESDDRVLDVGCGAGAALAPAARRAASAVGVELSPSMAERARAAAPLADVHVGDATSLDFEDGAFDVVVSAFTVFFMPDPTAALQEWRRVLAPGGRIAVSTWGPADSRWQQWERPLRGSFVPEMDPALARELGAGLGVLDRFNDPDKVQAELDAAGFSDIEVEQHAIEFVFEDEQAWWDFNWSHGSRMYLEALPEDAQRRFRAQMGAAMEQVRDERGFPRTYTALFARASAP
jgi:ubiquinone/menaquinone biosynthesis C-methylase UbiE